MFAPRYSLRTVLILIAFAAVFFLILGMGIRGEDWAIGLSAAIGSVFCVAITFAFFFMLFNLGKPAATAPPAFIPEDFSRRQNTSTGNTHEEFVQVEAVEDDFEV